MPSQAQFDANRANAQKSTGPKSEAGKAHSGLNAVTHGFTGQTIVVRAEEKAAYTAFVENSLAKWNPEGPIEMHLAYRMIGNQWRFNQLVSAESGMFALGRIEFAAQVEAFDPETASGILRALVLRNYAKEFDRLHRYESRINRMIKDDTAELKALQAARIAKKEKDELEMVQLHLHFKKDGRTWNPADFGFVLSIPEIEQLIARESERALAQNPAVAFDEAA